MGNEVIYTAIGSIVAVIVTLVTTALIFGKYREKVDTLEKSSDEMHIKIGAHQSEIDRLLEFKVSAQKFIDSKIYQSNSPLSLTPLGKKLVKDSGFDKIFDDIKDDLVTSLEADAPKDPYDVQEMARAYMDSLDTNVFEQLEPIKDYAYKTGSDFKQILRAGAILLRDYYFQRHPEIDTSTDF